MKKYIGKTLKTGLKAIKEYKVIGYMDNLYPELKQGGLLLVERAKKIYEVKESKVIETDGFLIYTGTFKKTHREPRTPKAHIEQTETLF